MSELRYERPASVTEACALLAKAPDHARILAGGTDLVVDLVSGHSSAEELIDIKHIPGMREIRWMPDGGLVIGAAVVMRQLYEEPRVAETYPALAQGAASVGSLQIRCRATVGGNLCNASPCADTAPPLLVLGAHVEVAGVDGSREVPLAELFVDVKKTALHPSEFVTAVVVPGKSRSWRSAFDKVKRVRGHDLALVNAAAAFAPAEGRLRAAIGSCGATPLLLPEIGGIKPGDDPEPLSRRLAESATAHICPIDDVRATAEYRRDMASLLCRRIVARLLGPEGRGR